MAWRYLLATAPPTPDISIESPASRLASCANCASAKTPPPHSVCERDANCANWSGEGVADWASDPGGCRPANSAPPAINPRRRRRSSCALEANAGDDCEGTVMAALRCAREWHAQEGILPRSRARCVEEMPKKADQARRPGPPLCERVRYSGRGVTVAEAVVIDASDFTVT